MRFMCSFDEHISRETKEYIQKWSKCELKFEKLNASSNEFILIKNDSFNDFIKTHHIGKCLEVESFHIWQISWSSYKRSYTS